MKAVLLTLLLLSALAQAKTPLNLTKDGLFLQGYDPVAYVKIGKAMKGRKQLDAAYGGGTFLFATDSDRAAFQKEPQRYLPAYGGWCAYAMAEGDFVDVDPETFKVVSGTAHLFYNGWLGNTLKKWNKDEARLKAAADAHWKKLNEAPNP